MKKNILDFNLRNIDGFLLDLAEGRLDEATSLALMDFVEANNLEDRLLSLQDLIFLTKENNTIDSIFFGSESLKKFEPSIDEQMLMMNYLDGALDHEQKSLVQDYEEQDEYFHIMLNQYKALKLVPDTSIQYPEKERLKRVVPINRIFPIKRGIAAAIMLMLVSFVYFLGTKSTQDIDSPHQSLVNDSKSPINADNGNPPSKEMKLGSTRPVEGEGKVIITFATNSKTQIQVEDRIIVNLKAKHTDLVHHLNPIEINVPNEIEKSDEDVIEDLVQMPTNEFITKLPMCDLTMISPKSRQKKIHIHMPNEIEPQHSKSSRILAKFSRWIPLRGKIKIKEEVKSNRWPDQEEPYFALETTGTKFGKFESIYIKVGKVEFQKTLK